MSNSDNYREQLHSWQTLRELTRNRLREAFTKACTSADGAEKSSYVLLAAWLVSLCNFFVDL
jgi:hypothetical protein